MREKKRHQEYIYDDLQPWKENRVLLLNAHNTSTLTLWTPSRGIRMYASCVWARLCGGKGGCSQQKARVQECMLCTPNWGFHHSSQKKKEGKKKDRAVLPLPITWSSLLHLQPTTRQRLQCVLPSSAAPPSPFPVSILLLSAAAFERFTDVVVTDVAAPPSGAVDVETVLTAAAAAFGSAPGATSSAAGYNGIIQKKNTPNQCGYKKSGNNMENNLERMSRCGSGSMLFAN